jgi:two-component system sensor histidine kinase KdpD
LSVLSRLSGRLSARKVDLRIPHDLPLIPIDPTLIDQVLVNLLENILRYTPPGSPIRIEMSQADQEMVLSIRDQGPGIPEGERERVFEKFYRGRGTSALDGGTGLGLTICRAVAAAHQGSITLSSPTGGGTLVELRLPIPDADYVATPAVSPWTQRSLQS